ncbi:MAG: methyltransferase domain-containing protein, partial [Propionicimonas sp.]
PAVAAAADALPFLPCAFSAVLVAQGLHRLAPGLVLPEFARVLAPGGHLAVMATFRDDSVPWVRRLAAILRRYDPQAMTEADAGAATIPASAHFPVIERRDFRRWIPITREGMLELVAGSPRLAGLEPSLAEPLRAEVADLYDSSAPRSEPLLLPYTVRCARAEVDHAELSSVLRLPEDGLLISLQSPPEQPE